MRKNGFTFIELLVVITIIAVLFAVGTVSYITISQNSRDARRKADLESIRQALEMCRTIDGAYPVSIYNSVTCPTSSTVTLKSTPTNPKTCTNHTNIQYSYSLSGGNYTLTAYCMGDGTGSFQVTNP